MSRDDDQLGLMLLLSPLMVIGAVILLFNLIGWLA